MHACRVWLSSHLLSFIKGIFAYHLHLEAHALTKQSLWSSQKCLIMVVDHCVSGIVVGTIATKHGL